MKYIRCAHQSLVEPPEGNSYRVQCDYSVLTGGKYCGGHEPSGTPARAMQVCGQIEALIKCYRAGWFTADQLVDSIVGSLELYFPPPEKKEKNEQNRY